MPATFMGHWQVMALSSVLQAQLFSIYPEYGGFNVTVGPHLCHIIMPRTKMAAEQPIVPGIMWTHTQGKHLPASHWRPNHFVVCLPTTGILFLTLSKNFSGIFHYYSSNCISAYFIIIGVIGVIKNSLIVAFYALILN